jgi:hypothetical protein
MSKEVCSVLCRVRVRDHFSRADREGGFRMMPSSPETTSARDALHILLATSIPGCLDGSWEGQMLRPERLSALVDAILATAGHAQTPDLPEGYVLIPREPTRGMWAACGDAVVGNTSVHHDVVVGLIYRAIVAVADSSTDYNPEFVQEILAADAAPPEGTIKDISELFSSPVRPDTRPVRNSE